MYIKHALIDVLRFISVKVRKMYFVNTELLRLIASTFSIKNNKQLAFKLQGNNSNISEKHFATYKKSLL